MTSIYFSITEKKIQKLLTLLIIKLLKKNIKEHLKKLI